MEVLIYYCLAVCGSDGSVPKSIFISTQHHVYMIFLHIYSGSGKPTRKRQPINALISGKESHQCPSLRHDDSRQILY